MDNYYIKKPLENLSEFEKYNIGLCGVENEEIVVYFQPKDEQPYSERLEHKALELFEVLE